MKENLEKKIFLDTPTPPLLSLFKKNKTDISVDKKIRHLKDFVKLRMSALCLKRARVHLAISEFVPRNDKTIFKGAAENRENKCLIDERAVWDRKLCP